MFFEEITDLRKRRLKNFGFRKKFEFEKNLNVQKLG